MKRTLYLLSLIPLLYLPISHAGGGKGNGGAYVEYPLGSGQYELLDRHLFHYREDLKLPENLKSPQVDTRKITDIYNQILLEIEKVDKELADRCRVRTYGLASALEQYVEEAAGSPIDRTINKVLIAKELKFPLPDDLGDYTSLGSEPQYLIRNTEDVRVASGHPDFEVLAEPFLKLDRTSQGMLPIHECLNHDDVFRGDGKAEYAREMTAWFSSNVSKNFKTYLRKFSYPVTAGSKNYLCKGTGEFKRYGSFAGEEGVLAFYPLFRLETSESKKPSCTGTVLADVFIWKKNDPGIQFHFSPWSDGKLKIKEGVSNKLMIQSSVQSSVKFKDTSSKIFKNLYVYKARHTKFGRHFDTFEIASLEDKNLTLTFELSISPKEKQRMWAPLMHFHQSPLDGIFPKIPMPTFFLPQIEWNAEMPPTINWLGKIEVKHGFIVDVQVSEPRVEYKRKKAQRRATSSQ